jgi:phage-related protein
MEKLLLEVANLQEEITKLQLKRQEDIWHSAVSAFLDLKSNLKNFLWKSTGCWSGATDRAEQRSGSQAKFSATSKDHL